MVSLWGSKQDDDPDATSAHNGDSGSARHAQPRASEADERTQLLPPPVQDGYLSPDDPAVSYPEKAVTRGRERSFDRAMLRVLTGVALQPLECTLLAVLHRSFCGDQLPVVGAPVGIDLHQPTRDALPWLRILRFLFHHFDSRTLDHHTTLLLVPV